MKKFLTLALLIFLLFSITGCNNQESNNNTAGDFKRPDFGQPEKPADIRGLVESITGNEIVILKIERPEREQTAEENKENDDERAPAANLGGGRMPGMGRPPQQGENNEFDEQAMIEKMKEMSTGSETVLIPVGIQMLKMSNGAEPAEANLSDITVNKMITVWLDESVNDRNIASFVMITN